MFVCRREALFYNDRINGATKYVRTVLILHVQDIKKKQRKQKPSGFIEHESWSNTGSVLVKCLTKVRRKTLTNVDKVKSS